MKIHHVTTCYVVYVNTWHGWGRGGGRRAGGWEPGRKGAVGGRKEGGSGSSKVAGTRRIEKNSQHFVIFRNRNGTKRREPLRKGAETGSKRNGKWEVQTPLPVAQALKVPKKEEKQ